MATQTLVTKTCDACGRVERYTLNAHGGLVPAPGASLANMPIERWLVVESSLKAGNGHEHDVADLAREVCSRACVRTALHAIGDVFGVEPCDFYRRLGGPNDPSSRCKFAIGHPGEHIDAIGPFAAAGDKL